MHNVTGGHPKATASTIFLVAGLLFGATSLVAQDTLTVLNNNVGIRTDTPLSMFHIAGSGTADLFAGMGPNPNVGPAFNFGYSGSSFGRSSGFVNVRADAGAVAPNPSFYFMTANVERFMVDNEGFVGLHLDSTFGNGFNPGHPIEAQLSGAHLTVGGVWTNASSRALKENIAAISAEDALRALLHLRPVTFNYKAAPEDPRLGFIAEDVPELIADPERKTLASMDVVALLARVVQEQQKQIEALQEALEKTQPQN